MKILIIVAHPDDEVLGCGGTIAKYYNDEKMLLTLTDGESARNDNLNLNRNILTKNEICKKLNISNFEYGNFPDNQLDSIPLLAITKFIEDKTKNFLPDIIFTHHPNCLNIDHSITYKAVITAFRPQKGLSQKIYSFFIPSSTDYNPLNNFNGNLYIKLDDKHVLIKKECLEIYINEMKEYPHSRSIENIENLMKVWGSEIGYKYCEKFQIIRDII
jgi:LmbE family N-acetylglucosaminyl deacetylase